MNLEKYIQLRLNTILNGKLEVKTNYGRIDILTFDSIYEIKEINNYKHAIGQLLDYKKDFPNYKLKAVLFGELEKLTKQKELHIISFCNSHHVIPYFVFMNFKLKSKESEIIIF